MSRRASSAIVLLVLMGAIGAGCSARNNSDGPQQSSAALAGGAADGPTAASPEANMIVAIETADGSAPACSGALLTPTVVLTARTCVNPAVVGKWPTVRVGSTFGSANRYFSTRLPLIEHDPNVTAHLGPTDPVSVTSNEQLALIFLDPTQPVLVDAMISPPQIHQLLQFPTSGAGNPDGSYVYSNVGASGWSFAGIALGPDAGTTAAGVPIVNAIRQGIFYSNNVSLYDNTDFPTSAIPSPNPFWLRSTSDNNGGALSGADVGGPIYQQGPVSVNGTTITDRQVFGIAVATGVAPGSVPTGACPATAQSCDLWVDITTDPNLSWIEQNLEIPLVASGPHTNANWFSNHAKAQVRGDGTPDWWIGEVDYTGPCATSTDADCDHWTDSAAELAPDGGPRPARDNCVGWFNPDQADVDDDGFGDPCDNCPAFSNVLQANTLGGPPAGFTPPQGRVADGTEEISASYPGDGCRNWTMEQGVGASAVWANSSTDAWALSESAAHWDGTSWTVTPIPQDTYTSIWSDEPNDAFAVSSQGAIQRWDGTKWSSARSFVSSNGTPINVPQNGTSLTEVWGSSAYNLWTLGYNALYMWSPTYNAWTPMPTTGLTLPTGGYLSFIWGTWSGDMWAGTSNVLAHFNGSSWTNTSLSAWPSMVLTGIWGSSTSDVWVIGYDSGTNGGELLHWNGTTWTQTTGISQTHLVSITGRATNDVFVAAADGMVWHWNGASWMGFSDRTAPLSQIVAEPQGLWGSVPIQTGNTVSMSWGLWRRHDLQWRTVVPSLSVMSMATPAPYEVLGYQGNETVTTWNGSTSSSSNAPYNGPGGITSSWGSSANNVYAVGSTQKFRPGGGSTPVHTFVHYDGTAWTSQALPAGITAPQAVSGTGPNDVWVVGGPGGISHFDGTAWTAVPSGTTKALYAVWADTPTDAWVVGNFGTALHWDGTSWSSVPGFTARSSANFLWGTGPNDVWAGGNFELAHWDGTGWSRVEIGVQGKVAAMGGTGPSDIWAAIGQEKVLHYDGTQWTPYGVEEAIMTASNGMKGGGFESGAYDVATGLWIGSIWGQYTNLQASFAAPQCQPSGYECVNASFSCQPYETSTAGLALQRLNADGVTYTTVATATAAAAAAGWTTLTEAYTGSATYRVCDATGVHCTLPMAVSVATTCACSCPPLERCCKGSHVCSRICPF